MTPKALQTFGRFGHDDKVAKAVVLDTPSRTPTRLLNPSIQEGAHLLLPQRFTHVRQAMQQAKGWTVPSCHQGLDRVQGAQS
jgi:hypothetical protein